MEEMFQEMYDSVKVTNCIDGSTDGMVTEILARYVKDYIAKFANKKGIIIRNTEDS